MARPRKRKTADDRNCRGNPDCGAEQRENDEQTGSERGGSNVELWPHQDRRFAGEHVADDPADARRHDAHRKRRHWSNPIAERLCGAVGCISGEARGIEPQQRLPREPMPAGDPHDQGCGDADEERRVGVHPEHRRSDQQVAQCPAADAGHDREKDERDQCLPLFRSEKRAGDSEYGDAEIIEEDERGWVHRCNGLH